MALRPYVVESDADLPVFIHDKCGANNAFEDASIVLLLAPRTPLSHDGMIRIGPQQKVESVLFLELLQTFDGIRTDSDDRDLRSLIRRWFQH